ncbi:hypothetical protein M0P65_05860 [Candidatus Gracilibacteria bacterium]|jgi:hypothetical protein|nr:hypothetical protein [Candidatus Gracilibacteria bacterium]
MPRSEIRYCMKGSVVGIKEFKNILFYEEISEEIITEYHQNGVCYFANSTERNKITSIVVYRGEKKYHIHINDCINKDTFIEIINLMKLAANRYRRLKQYQYKETLKLNDNFKTMII